jgi:hypothetical protein
VPGNLCHLKSEPTITGAKVDYVHTRTQANRGKDACRIGPKRLPPTGGWHFGALEKSCGVLGHIVCGAGSAPL